MSHGWELARISEWFRANAPAAQPRFSAPADVAGPLRRLFAQANGQLAGTAVFDGHTLMSVDESRGRKDWLDTLAADEEWSLSWWDPAWHPFAEDAAGNLLVVHQGTGEVIAFRTDDEARDVLGPTLTRYLAEIAHGLESGALVYSPRFGVVSPAELERLERTRIPTQETETPPPEPSTSSLTYLLALVLLAALGVMAIALV